MDGSRPRSCLGLPPREEGSDRPHHKAAAKLPHSPHHIASAPSPSKSIQGGPSKAALNCTPAPTKTDECVPSLPALFNTPTPYDPSQTRSRAPDAPNSYNPPSYTENAPITILAASPTPPSARPSPLRRKDPGNRAIRLNLKSTLQRQKPRTNPPLDGSPSRCNRNELQRE